MTALGGLELVKLLIHKKAEAKKANAEAVIVENEAEDSKYTGIIQGYETLLAQDSTHIQYYKQLVKDEIEKVTELQNAHNEHLSTLQAIIEEKNAKIMELMNQINDLTSENTSLTFLKCTKLHCGDRIPPFLTEKLDIIGGKLITAEELQNE